VLVRGEALYLLATVLPRGFAERLHVYFPDPWPKNRHHRRRLFDPATVDLVVGVLAPGGELAFATDFLDYGEQVAEILAGHPDLEVHRRDAPWPDGARTHYEAKYITEGRPILRLEGRRRDAAGAVALHPAGRTSLLAAVAPR
jgi:tRNA (guanine-N7-)-methyltransferase